MDEQRSADESELTEPERTATALSPDERRDLRAHLGRIEQSELPPTVRTLVNLHRRGRVIR